MYHQWCLKEMQVLQDIISDLGLNESYPEKTLAALRIRDNETGDRNILYDLCEFRKGEWYFHDNPKQAVLTHKGDAILSVWPLGLFG
jgi:hypothetical protein